MVPVLPAQVERTAVPTRLRALPALPTRSPPVVPLPALPALPVLLACLDLLSAPALAGLVLIQS